MYPLVAFTRIQYCITIIDWKCTIECLSDFSVYLWQYKPVAATSAEELPTVKTFLNCDSSLFKIESWSVITVIYHMLVLSCMKGGVSMPDACESRIEQLTVLVDIFK